MIRRYWKPLQFMYSNNTVRTVWMGITAPVIILFLNGCVITSSRPLPNETALTPSPKGNDVIRFSFYPGEVAGEKKDDKASMAVLPIEPDLLQRYLDKYSSFSSAVISSTAPAKGTYIVLTMTTQPLPAVTQLSQFIIRYSCPVAIFTLLTLPCYQEDVVTLRYDVHSDDRFLKSYSYDVTTRRFFWWGVLPVSWLNYVTTKYEESCASITSHFITDARRDGYL